MWQLTAASQAAVEVLQRAAVPYNVLEQLLSLGAVPYCLLPFFERALLSKYGCLEAVWGPDCTELQESLLALPMQAVQVLLASGKLKVRAFNLVLKCGGPECFCFQVSCTT
jgi:hypothetical protein